MVSAVKCKADLEKFLAEAGDKIVVIDFFATWCGPCRYIAPHLEKCAAENDDLVILKVDVDENIDLAKEYNIMMMPTILFIQNKAVVKTFSGSNYEKVVETIKQLKGGK